MPVAKNFRKISWLRHQHGVVRLVSSAGVISFPVSLPSKMPSFMGRILPGVTFIWNIGSGKISKHAAESLPIIWFFPNCSCPRLQRNIESPNYFYHWRQTCTIIISRWKKMFLEHRSCIQHLEFWKIAFEALHTFREILFQKSILYPKLHFNLTRSVLQCRFAEFLLETQWEYRVILLLVRLISNLSD